MDGAAEGQQRPGLADAANLLRHVISMHLHQFLKGGVMDKGLRGWWASPPRTGMQRLIIPYEYRHLRGFGITRIIGGSVAAAAGIICLSYRVYGWGAFFLALAALNLSGGSWYLAITRSQSSGT